MLLTLQLFDHMRTSVPAFVYVVRDLKYPSCFGGHELQKLQVWKLQAVFGDVSESRLWCVIVLLRYLDGYVNMEGSAMSLIVTKIRNKTKK